MNRHQLADDWRRQACWAEGLEASARELVSCAQELLPEVWRPKGRVGNRDEAGRAGGGQIHKGLRRPVKHLKSSPKLVGTIVKF